MAITKNTTLEEIDKIVENFVHEDLTLREQFSPDVIKFINLNNQYYWLKKMELRGSRSTKVKH